MPSCAYTQFAAKSSQKYITSFLHNRALFKLEIDLLETHAWTYSEDALPYSGFGNRERVIEKEKSLILNRASSLTTMNTKCSDSQSSNIHTRARIRLQPNTYAYAKVGLQTCWDLYEAVGLQHFKQRVIWIENSEITLTTQQWINWLFFISWNTKATSPSYRQLAAKSSLK